jgi:hypothetical protein
MQGLISMTVFNTFPDCGLAVCLSTSKSTKENYRTFFGLGMGKKRRTV